MATETYDFVFSLVLIGDPCVGKTAILHRFSEDAFKISYLSTIGRWLDNDLSYGFKKKGWFFSF